MNEVYVDMTKENKWIRKYFPKKDFVSIDELLNCIEDLDGEIDHLNERIEELENPYNPEEDFMYVAKRQWEQ